MPKKFKNKSKKSGKNSTQIDVAKLPPPAWQGKRLYFGSAPESLAPKNPKMSENSASTVDVATLTNITSKDAATSTNLAYNDMSTQTYLDFECSSCSSTKKFSKLAIDENEAIQGVVLPRSSTNFDFKVIVDNYLSQDQDEEESSAWSWSKVVGHGKRRVVASTTGDSISSGARQGGHFKRYISHPEQTEADSQPSNIPREPQTFEPTPPPGPSVAPIVDSREFLD